MFYRKNMGSKESWARVIGGALIVACSLTQIGLTLLGLVLATSGVLTALTGLIGFCPACAMAGRSPPPRPAIRSLWRGCCANCSPTSAAMQGTSAIARRPLRTWFRKL